MTRIGLGTTTSGWKVHHWNIKNRFLIGNFKEELYVNKAPGFSKVHHKHKMCFK